MEGSDSIIFDSMKFSDMIKEAYINNKEKDSKITYLLDQLSKMVKNVNDATIAVPLIKEYLEISVKNDDQMIKLIGVVQRHLSTSSKNNSPADSFSLSEEEKAQILEGIDIKQIS